MTEDFEILLGNTKFIFFTFLTFFLFIPVEIIFVNDKKKGFLLQTGHLSDLIKWKSIKSVIRNKEKEGDFLCLCGS